MVAATASAKSGLDQLTGLRFFAALLVFFHHSGWEGTNAVLKQIFWQGYVGVSFFFMLSGFILSYSYADKIRSKSISATRYLLLRLARLTPLHFATAIPLILLAVHKHEFSFLTTVLNLTYLQSFIPNSLVYFALNGPSWSLSNEMFFYVCFFFLVFLPARARIAFTLGLLGVIGIAAVYVTATLDGVIIAGEYTFAHWLFYVFPGFRLLEFLVGMWLYDVWKSGVRLPSWTIGLSYVALVVAMYFAITIPEAFRMSLYYLPVMVLLLYAHVGSDGAVVRFLSSQFLVLLGNASFAFYLLHQHSIGPLKFVFAKLHLGNWSFFVLSLLVIYAISIGVYLIYERRAERTLKQWVNKYHPLAPPASYAAVV